MSATLLSERNFGLVLGLVATGLAALTILPWLPSRARPAAPDTPSAATASPVSTRLPPFAQFAAIVDRPLFAPSRRPSARAKSGTPVSGLETRYRLLGVVTDGSRRRALLAEGTRTFEIGEGDAVEGWTIKRILQDRLTLASPSGEAAALTMRRLPTVPPGVSPAVNALINPKR